MRARLAQGAQGNNSMSINIEIASNLEDNRDLRGLDPKLIKIIEDHEISKKLCISTCPSIKKSHFMLRYDVATEIFEI